MKLLGILGLGVFGIVFLSTKQATELTGAWMPLAGVGFIFAIFLLICTIGGRG